LKTCDRTKSGPSSEMLKVHKSCIMECGSRAEEDLKREIARITISDGKEGYDVPPGIVYTRVVNTESIGSDEILVKTVETLQTPQTISSKPVTIADIFTPRYEGTDKTLCEAVGEMMNKTLSATSYVVNGKPNPRFVEAECINIHAKIRLGQALSRKADDIVNLMNNAEYTRYCTSQRSSKEQCESVKPWMKTSADQKPEDIQPLCKFEAGRFFSNTCTADTDKVEEIKKTIRDKVNSCIAESGCITDTHGEKRTQKKFMRLDTAENFKHADLSSRTPTQICCRRSFKAVAVGGLTMERLYKITGNMSFSDQLELINRSSMTDDEKRVFLASVQDSHNMGEKLVKYLNIDSNASKFMDSFASIVREALHTEMKKFATVEGSDTQNPETVEESESVKAKISEITGEDESKSSILMSILKGVTKGVTKAIVAIAKILYKTIKYFLRKGFDLLVWLFHHPTTAMWLAHAALYFKKKCCEMIDIGIFGKTKEFAEDNILATGAIIKKYFLQKAFEFVDSAGFTSYISYMSTIIETGILAVINCIPAVGPFIALNIKMSGGLSVVLTVLATTFREAMTYAFHAMLLREAGNDLLAIITGTCIAPPRPTTQVTIKGVLDEAKIATDYVSESASKILDVTAGVAGDATDKMRIFASSILQSMKWLT
jgi:hypothetical protein